MARVPNATSPACERGKLARLASPQPNNTNLISIGHRHVKSQSRITPFRYVAIHAASDTQQLATPQPSTSCADQHDDLWRTTRRGAILLMGSATALLASCSNASASKLPFLDAGWEALGGGPADLVFPEEFLGVWDVSSVLTRVETPLGEEVVPNLAAVRRAQNEDLQRPTSYQVSFVRNGNGKVVYDRRFNTASMLAMYYDHTLSFEERIQWSVDDPNVLSLTLPAMSVRTRVTRRSEDFPQTDRIETSEYVESVYNTPGGGTPRIKASQCFTKYKWRSAEAALRDRGPAIVATQVVSDYLTPYDGDEQYLRAMNKPYALYTYRMAFRRPGGVDAG